MKKRYRALEIILFCLLFFAIILPSLLIFVPAEQFVIGEKISFFQIEISLFCLVLYFMFKKQTKINCKQTDKKIKLLINSGSSFLVLGELLVLQALLQLCSFLFFKDSINDFPQINKSINGIFIAIINFITAVIIEEFLYRHYLPYVLNKILSHGKNKQYAEIIGVIISGLLFGLAHHGSGILGVINAFLAHYFLFYNYKKTGSLIYNFIVHLVYNLIIFAGVFQMSSCLKILYN